MAVKISVIKNVKVEDIVEEYGKGVDLVCPVCKVGQHWLVKDDLAKPEGFCSWAWADIQRDIVTLAMGGNFSWMKKPGTMVSACTDGTRPVIFKLERV